MKAILPLVALAVIAAGAVAQSPKLNTAATKTFTAHVQPVLANVCADCHAHKAHGSGFKLKPYDPAFNDPQTADANLQAVTPLLDVVNPHASPLLKYAATAHGKAADPPLKVGHPALAKLELWVHWACGPDGSTVPIAVPPTPKMDAAVVQAGAREPQREPAKLPPVKAAPIQPFADKPVPEPEKPNPADPFDPTQFNQQATRK